MPRTASRNWIQKELDAQRQWVKDHGETLAGYIERYGSKDDADHYGDGGEAIYAADIAELQKLERMAGEAPVPLKNVREAAETLVAYYDAGYAEQQRLEQIAYQATAGNVGHLESLVSDLRDALRSSR